MLTFSILILCLVSYFIYDRANHKYEQRLPYDEDLDTLTKLLLDKAESGEYRVTLHEYTIRVDNADTGDMIGNLWISNYPYSYGHFYDYSNNSVNHSVSYETFKRTRALHLKLLAEKKALEDKQRKGYIESKIKQLSGE